MRLDRMNDRVRVARRFDRDLIIWTETVGEHTQVLTADLHLTGLADHAVLPDRDLRELPVHIQTNAPHAHPVHLHRRR
jgi:hypothetical protein